MTQLCVHRAGPAGTYSFSGNQVEAFDCEKFNDHCTDALGTPLRVCGQSCCEFDPHPRPTTYLNCLNRGPATERSVPCGCNIDRTIYECSKHGCCVKRLPSSFRPDQSMSDVHECSKCEDATEIDAHSVICSPTPRVALIVTSHNYGRFLSECLDSVLDQSVQPFEIMIVDDGSSDETPQIAAKYADRVRYIRIEAGNVFEARKTGFKSTSAEFLVFLDADDTLGTTYLAECLAVMASDDAIGIVTSDLQQFGDMVGLLHHKTCDIETANWIHAGSMVRRAALSMCEVFESTARPSRTAHDDWFVWKRMLRCGWRAGRIENPSYNYRKHPSSMLASGPLRTASYYQRAALELEPLTLVVPVCRERYWHRLTEWIENQNRITDLLVIDSADDLPFRRRIKSWIADQHFHSTRHVRRPISNGLADRERPHTAAYHDVQAVMPRIYRHLWDVTTEFMFIVEDDILPPDDAISTLMSRFDHDVAGVSGVVPSPYQLGYSVTGETFDSTVRLSDRSDVQQVAFTGFGCLAIRRSAVRSAPPFHNGGTGNYDIEFCRSVKQRGWRWLTDWSVRCGHRDIPRPNQGENYA